MVHISGIIGEDVRLIDLMEQVAKEKGNEIRVVIDSPGGVAEEGLSMFDYLKGLNRHVVTIAQNQCGSIASVVFMAGEERIANCGIFIHNPFFADVQADVLTKQDLQDAYDSLEELTKRINDIYAKTSGLDKKGLQALMDGETEITPVQAVNLGLATKAGNPVANNRYTPVAKSRDRAVLNAINQIKSKQKMKKNTLSQRIKNLLSGKVKNIDYTDVDGNTVSVDVPTERESQLPEVGDAAQPDGEFTLEDGTVIVVSGGTVTEVRTVESMDMEALRAENERLRSMLEAAAARLEEYEAMEAETSKQLNLRRNFSKNGGGKTAFEKAIEERKGNPKRKVDNK